MCIHLSIEARVYFIYFLLCVEYSKPIEDGKLYELRFGHKDIRLHGEPFPLYPGELLEGATPVGKTCTSETVKWNGLTFCVTVAVDGGSVHV